MPDIAVCPEPSVLKQLLLGQLDQGESAALDQHLLACERCCTVLHELEAHDTLAYAVRALTAEEPPLDDRVEAVIERLKGVTLPGKAFDETIARNVEATEDAWDLEKLLDPPEAEGELGRFGGYRVLRVLGAGGMGLVFEAEELKLRRRVALKVMKRSLAAKDEHHQRFLREARAAAAIEHPHIVTVFQVGEHRGLPFMAMQLLKGESLDDRLRHEAAKEKEDGLPSPSSRQVDGLGIPARRDSLRGALPLNEVLRIGRETAEALAEAHSRNLIHRDIKPGNIWLEGANGWVKLVDFGLAHAAEDVHLTQTGAILGTPAYMSPEQARGEAVDGRCDLYSLGAVLFKLTTGEVPFRGATTLAVLMALANDAPRPPREINPDLPPALSDLILRLLAKQPHERFESAQAVADAIRAIEAELVERNSFRSDPIISPDVQKRNEFRSTTRRWPLVAAAAAALFIIAAIVIIVRDKQGKEVMRANVADGHSVTLSEIDASTDAPAATIKPASGDLAPPIKLPEPPPLEEWLKGREILTVAQDGRGHFKTIQAALDALQSGQVIEVLDSGPYRERLEVDTVPPNTGLISRIGTIIELREWKFGWKEERGDFYLGHVFRETENFRLHGFEFVFPEAIKLGRRILIEPASKLVVENCYFHQAPGDAWSCPEVMFGVYEGTGGLERSLWWVRGCLIEGYFDLIGRRPDGVTAVVEQNYFVSDRSDHHLHFHGGHWRQVVVRHNVFCGKVDYDLLVQDVAAWKPSSLLEVSNNTTTASLLDLIVFTGGVPGNGVSVRNNLRTTPRLLRVLGAKDSLAAAPSVWRVDHNAYPEITSGAPAWLKEGLMPRSPADIAAMPRFLSKVPASRDYLRMAADSSLAHAGAGGEWPSFVGALPLGPAPKGGDWFTRLRERWQASELVATLTDVADIPPSVEIPEPPPLEEWLKGRTVLTVAQDGSGQFKTIQAALDALKPHQAIKVLDRGPYREAVRIRDLPDDTGLFSDQQTVLEVPAWPLIDGSPWGQIFGPANGFRLNGFRLIGPPRRADEEWHDLLHLTSVSALVLERCYFGWTTPPEPNLGSSLLNMTFQDDDSSITSFVVRECLFDSGSFDIGGTKNAQWRGTILIEHNYFANSFLALTGPREHEVLVRHNVCDFKRAAIWIQGLDEVSGLVEISNNTAMAGGYSVVQGAPKQGMVVRNNIMETDIGLDAQALQVQADIVKNWRRDHNCYAGATNFALSRAPTDLSSEPRFLSTERGGLNYLRIAGDSPLAQGGAGGEWPNYIGAFPPGPAPKEGDWFTRLRERWSNAVPEPTGEKVAEIPPPIKLPEPPPLEEWLKGREILTVAQNGSAQFKTIQAALDALQPGQVVSVLDRGPYRERLVLEGIPRDTGLISKAGTVIELAEWKFAWKEEGGDLHFGHVFADIDGFRLHGFEWGFPEKITLGRRLYFRRTGRLLLEDCHFRSRSTDTWDAEPVVLENFDDQGPALSIWVRHCLIEGYLSIVAQGAVDVTAVVEQNDFKSEQADHHLHLLGDAWKQVVVRHNVFRGDANFDMVVDRGWKPSSLLEVSNNTSLTTPRDLVVFQASAEHGSVTVRNNLRTAPRLLGVLNGAEKDLLTAQRDWHVDHNAYPDPPATQPWMKDEAVPRSASDVAMRPTFLSKDPADPDYLRIRADGPLVTAGAGGDWPNYVGALPPGPPPKDGDWLTRLRERWQVSP